MIRSDTACTEVRSWKVYCLPHTVRMEKRRHAKVTLQSRGLQKYRHDMRAVRLMYNFRNESTFQVMIHCRF